MRIIGSAFVALAIYLGAQSTIVLVVGFRPHHSSIGIAWTALTAVAMFALASGKARVGATLHNPVLEAEGRVTMIDGILAAAVLAGLVLNTFVGWWWADPVAGYVILYYAIREARASLRNSVIDEGH
jgi:divalent metal cation (Fe/Co/Zn/Cd) transporter